MAKAAAAPGSMSSGSYGAGSPSHLIMEWLKDETKTDIVHIPYRTSPLPVPGMSVTSWHGIWAPAATPAAVLARLNAEMVAASRDPEIVQKIRALNVEPLGVSPAEMNALIKRDAEIFNRVVKAKNIKLD